MIKLLSTLQKLMYWATQWKTFKLPKGEFINCYKDRSRVDSILFPVGTRINWVLNDTQARPIDPGKVSYKGVGSGTPMQLGREQTRVVTWGSGYGRVNQWKSEVPLPLDGGRYWVTGYPSPQYDKRCIIVGVDGVVHELIQFDQDLPILQAGLPQQALNRGAWRDGKLIDGVPVTASELPGSAYIWGPGSINAPHVQGMTCKNYLDGDGDPAFLEYGAQRGIIQDLPKCGEWYFLDVNSDSYDAMISKGGECAARAKAMVEYGVRLLDRGDTTSFLTQAGSWADATNIREFTINLNDLRRVY